MTDSIITKHVLNIKGERLNEAVHTNFLAHLYDDVKVSLKRGVCLSGSFQGTKFALKVSLGSARFDPSIELAMHTWRIKHFEQLQKWVMDFVSDDKQLYEFIMCEMIVTRFDACLDTLAPKGFMGENLYRPGAVRSDRFRSTNETFYFGTGSDVLMSYEKPELGSQHAEYVFPQELNPKSNKYVVQRVERRLKGRKLPIRHLYQIPELKDFQAFGNSKMLILNREKLMKIPEAKRAALELEMTKYGLHQVRKKLNTSRNFSRNYLHCFDDHSHLLKDAWTAKMANYLQ